MKSYSSHCSTLYINVTAEFISDEQMHSNMSFTSTAYRRSCAVLEKNHFQSLCTNTHFEFLELIMKIPTGNILNSFNEDQIKMILNGLDLLDEYYSTEVDYNNVLKTREIKNTIREHIPKNLIN